jgi:hypothetical protein
MGLKGSGPFFKRSMSNKVFAGYVTHRYGQSKIKVDVYTKVELIVIKLYTKVVKQNLFEMFNPVAYGKYLVRTSYAHEWRCSFESI